MIHRQPGLGPAPDILARAAVVIVAVSIVAASRHRQSTEVATSEPVSVPSETPRVVSPARLQEPPLVADLTVWPYRRSMAGTVELPHETRLWALPNYNGGSARGGDDRLTVVLSDTTYHQHGAAGFWPLIVKMPLPDAASLHEELTRVIAEKGDDWGSITGMEAVLDMGMYSLDGSAHVRLVDSARWGVLPRPLSDAAGADGDRRIVVVIDDAVRSFQPVVVKMDREIALEFFDALGRVIDQKKSGQA